MQKSFHGVCVRSGTPCGPRGAMFPLENYQTSADRYALNKIKNDIRITKVIWISLLSSYIYSYISYIYNSYIYNLLEQNYY